MKRFLNRIFIVAFVLMVSRICSAQTAEVRFSKEQYERGDTISFDCTVPKYLRDSVHFATLYLFIENLETKRWWNYRYPITDGSNTSTLIIDSSLPQGKYAFHFTVRKSFFRLSGIVPGGKNTGFTYSVITSDNNSVSNFIKTDADGFFSVKGLLFQDTAHFVVSIPQKELQNQARVKIETPLDSAFVPEYTIQKLVSIGKTQAQVTVSDSLHLQSEFSGFFDKQFMLPEVTVIKNIRNRKPTDVFNEKYSTGLFKNSDGWVFDGMTQNTIAQSLDVFQFLAGRVPGLRVWQMSNSMYFLQMRGTNKLKDEPNVDVYLDEILVAPDPYLVRPSDIAMIKAIPPPSFIGAGGIHGVIAIYTKHGANMYEAIPSPNNFKVAGYSPSEVRWGTGDGSKW